MIPQPKRVKVGDSKTRSPWTAMYHEDSDSESEWTVTNTSTGETFYSDDPTTDSRTGGQFVFIQGPSITNQGEGDRFDSAPEDADASCDIERFTFRGTSKPEKYGGEHVKKAHSCGSAGAFGALPSSVMINCLLFADELHQVGSVSKFFAAQAAVKTRLVAQTAARMTRPARAAAEWARETSERAEAQKPKASSKTLKYDVGEYCGAVKGKKPSTRVAHGLGEYHASQGLEMYRGEWRDGQEHGAGSVTYADGSSYSGGFVEGQRSGFGVFCFTDDYQNECRYEGQWDGDRRAGFGLVVGGAYRFLVGRFEGGVPVGHHMAFNFDMDSAEALDMT
jgi:hypothetical protein